MYVTPNTQATKKSVDDGWDWPWILYISQKELGWTEEQTWASTPRKFYAILQCALEYADAKAGGNKPKKQEEKKQIITTTIDKIPGW